jgi:hypothetical protein
LQIERIVNKVVHPILANLHLPLYHSEPEFHASFAWCLLRRSASVTGQSAEVLQSHQPDSGTTDALSTPLIPELLCRLSEEFEQRILSSQPSGGWVIDTLELKIANDITQLCLAGSR